MAPAAPSGAAGSSVRAASSATPGSDSGPGGVAAGSVRLVNDGHGPLSGSCEGPRPAAGPERAASDSAVRRADHGVNTESAAPIGRESAFRSADGLAPSCLAPAGAAGAGVPDGLLAMTVGAAGGTRQGGGMSVPSGGGVPDGLRVRGRSSFLA